MKTKQECLEALQRANRYGNLDSNKLSSLTPIEREEFRTELTAWLSGGTDDFSRDTAQAARIQRLEAELAAACA
jgi:hypothetical protein